MAGETAHHLGRVLRAELGQLYELSDGKRVWLARIAEVKRDRVEFSLMEERYRRHSTIITTNLIYDEWPNFLGNRPMAEALLSRLRHCCHTVHIQGPPLRDPQG